MTESDMPQHTIRSVSDALALVRWGNDHLADLNKRMTAYENLFPHGTWFRGQEEIGWGLIPSVYRRDAAGSLLYGLSEIDLVVRFRLRLPQHRVDASTTFDWLSLMQHHGCPTRLLDWSESVLVALYFAVVDKAGSNDRDGELFVLNSLKLNNRSSAGATRLKPEDLPCWLRAQQAEDVSFRAIVNEMKNSRRQDIAQVRQMLRDDKNALARHLSQPVLCFRS
jgi:hypothetical protein